MVVSLVNRTLLVNGVPFEVRGVAYSPVRSFATRSSSPPDLFTASHSAVWLRDLDAIQSIGFNVVRLFQWDPALHDDDLTFLDACATRGLYVVLPISHWWLAPYCIGSRCQHYSDSVISNFTHRVVAQAAAHAAILMWGVTNEAAFTYGQGAYARIALATHQVRASERM